MEPVYVYSESTVRPSEVMVGKKVVYLRKNIVEDLRKDNNDEEMLYYTYQEAKVTPEEFNEILKAGEVTVASSI